ncbi:MAG TPA: SRPBCC domain-containing protein [Polyangiaceae bacterium]|nr:SRPBCC domain-containing protein [Polyangiaceae bacterium]
MSGDASSSIQVEQQVAASRRQLWEACSSAESLARWQADDVSGEVRAGSKLTLRYPAFGAEVSLNVRECVPEQLLVFQTEGSQVELRFFDGGIALVHSGAEVAVDPQGILSSWRLSLAQLAHSVERHPEEDRTVNWVLRRAQASAELVHLCFTEDHCLSQWLGQGRVGAEAERYEIQGQEGLALSGIVKVNVSGRDVALSCETLRDSMLILRTLPSPSGASERIIALCWSSWGEQDAPWMLPTLEALESASDDLQLFLRRTGRD